MASRQDFGPSAACPSTKTDVGYRAHLIIEYSGGQMENPCQECRRRQGGDLAPARNR